MLCAFALVSQAIVCELNLTNAIWWTLSEWAFLASICAPGAVNSADNFGG